MSDLFGDYYKRLKDDTGPFITEEAKEETRDFWLSRIETGPGYLLERAERETNPMVLKSVEDLLVEHGAGSLPAIAEDLYGNPTGAHAALLIRLLRRITDVHAERLGVEIV